MTINVHDRLGFSSGCVCDRCGEGVVSRGDEILEVTHTAAATANDGAHDEEQAQQSSQVTATRRNKEIFLRVAGIAS